MDCILWSQPMLRRVNPVAGEPPTGEPDAGDPLVRFGGRGGHRRPYPYPGGDRLGMLMTGRNAENLKHGMRYDVIRRRDACDPRAGYIIKQSAIRNPYA